MTKDNDAPAAQATRLPAKLMDLLLDDPRLSQLRKRTSLDDLKTLVEVLTDRVAKEQKAVEILDGLCNKDFIANEPTAVAQVTQQPVVFQFRYLYDDGETWSAWQDADSAEDLRLTMFDLHQTCAKVEERTLYTHPAPVLPAGPDKPVAFMYPLPSGDYIVSKHKLPGSKDAVPLYVGALPAGEKKDWMQDPNLGKALEKAFQKAVEKEKKKMEKKCWYPDCDCGIQGCGN